VIKKRLVMSHSYSTSSALSKKRKELDEDNATVSDGEDAKLSYEDLHTLLLDRIKEIAELKQVIEDLKTKKRCDDDSDDDVSDDEMEEIDANDPWNSKYLELRYYRISNGHSNPPRSDRNLGIWINNQRSAYRNLLHGKKPALSKKRAAMLEGLGFSWGKNSEAPVSWEARFAELEKFKTTFGHCRIHVHPTNPSALAKWAAAQRQEYKRFRNGKDSLLCLEQIGQLKGIGFKWKTPRST
jgi:Helicase associated domain